MAFTVSRGPALGKYWASPICAAGLVAAVWLLYCAAVGHAERIFPAEDPNIAVSVEVMGMVQPPTLGPGEFGRIALEVEISPPWYIYSLTNPGETGPPTQVEITVADLHILPERFESEPALGLGLRSGGGYRYHQPRAQFWVDFQVPEQTAPGIQSITGSVVYAACDGTICLRERSASFELELTVVPGATREQYAQRPPPPVSAPQPSKSFM